MFGHARLSNFWSAFPVIRARGREKNAGKASGSFLKKRTKKLLISDGAGPAMVQGTVIADAFKAEAFKADASTPKICYPAWMLPSESLLRHRDTVHAIIGKHRANNPRLFGSAARGEDSEASDLDILVDPAPGMTLFDLGAIVIELEALLGVKVDVLTSGAIPAHFAEAMKNDLRPL